MIAFARSTTVVLMLAVLCTPARAQNEGQDDLDKATEARLNARTLADMGEVIRLLDSALEKGLDEGNTAYARSLLNSTLIFRGMAVSKVVFEQTPLQPGWPQLRKLALADLERALKLGAEQPEALYFVGRLNLLPGGDAKRAAEAIRQAAKLLPGDEKPALKAQVLMLLAAVEEDDAKKLADLNEAVRLAPDDATVWRARGLHYAAVNEHEKALADLDKALELDPDHAVTYGVKAAVLVELKKYDEALVVLDKLSELEPDSSHPLMQKARIHALRENFDAALHELGRVLSADPDHAAALLLRAAVYEEKGEKEKALADLDTLLEARPDFAPAVRMKAMLLAGEQKYAEAIAELGKLIGEGPKDPLALLQLAMLYMADKQLEKAIETYTAVLEQDPKEVAALRGRGDALLNLGRHEEAIRDYEKALEIEPDDSGVLNNLAWVLSTSPYDKVRDGKRAIELATKACEVTEYKEAHILSTLGAAYAETGDFESGTKWVKKGLETAEGDEEKQALEKELKSYQGKKPVRELLKDGEPVDLDKQPPPKAEEPEPEKSQPEKPEADKPKPDESEPESVPAES